MNDKKIKQNGIYANTLKLIFQKSLTLFIGQGILLFLFSFIITPLLSGIYYIALKLTGYSYVTLDNLSRFLLNPITLGILLVLFLIFGLFLLYDIFFLIIFFSSIKNGKRVRFYLVYFQALHRLLICLKDGGVRLIPSAWLSLCIFNLPLLFLSLSRNRFLRFGVKQASGPLLWILIIPVLIGLLGLLILRNSFVFHYSLVHKGSYRQLRESCGSIKAQKPIRTLLYYIPWNILLSLLILLIYAFAMLVLILLTAGIPDRSLAVATFISVNDSMNRYLLIMAFFIGTVGNLALFTQLFYHYSLIPEPPRLIDGLPEKIRSGALTGGEALGRKAYLRILRYSLFILFVINIYFYARILYNGSPLDYMNLDTVKLSAHRGASMVAPENTIPAIEKAIDEKADYIELDVRVTRDGELVLLHDSNLRRTTGMNQYIWEMDYPGVTALDAGRWKGLNYQGTKIPTLREVLELCKGKVVLNLELKYMNSKENIEKKTVELIKEYDMDWQCVITSNNLTCLKRVKKLDPNLQTGYIVTQLYKGLSTNDAVDFFSMKSSLITRKEVREIHKNGKKLYVWTVNSKPELERLKRLGVDNIITDDPAYAREVLSRADSDQYFLTLLKVVKD